MIKPKIDSHQIKLFRPLFRGREDVYARFWQNPASNKSGYAPVYRLNNQARPLNDTVIWSHLTGKEIVGIYPLLLNNTSYFLAVDFDGSSWLGEASSLIITAKQSGISGYLERSRSGNGGHVWFFFKTNIPAWKVRQLGKYLLSQVEKTQPRSFDRLFPSQDEHSGKRLGNLIALPLQGGALKHGNTIFINQDGVAYQNQWNYLRSFQKISEAKVDQLLASAIVIIPKSQKEEKQPPTQIKEKQIRLKTSSSPRAKLILSNQIYIPEAFLPDKLYKFLKQKLNFANPQYYELERRGYSTWKTPRIIKNLEIADNGIYLPAGFLHQIQLFAEEHGLTELHQSKPRIALYVNE